MLVFATVSALVLAKEWNMNYAELIPYATPGFIAFAVCSFPAGWLADKWSREKMMILFFFGIGISAVLTSFAQNPVELSVGLLLIGIFAAIYHPVGLAMVVQGREKMGIALAINGVFGNLGVACAALLTGFLIDIQGWRVAFIVPGIVTVLVGILYAYYICKQPLVERSGASKPVVMQPRKPEAAIIDHGVILRVLSIVLVSTAIGGFVFQSTTFALPKVFDERLGPLVNSATLLGGYAFLVFGLAAFAQIAVGYLVDHFSIKAVFSLVALHQSLFFALMLHQTGIDALVISIAFMLVVFGQIPINDVLIGRISKNDWRSRIYAIRYVVTFSVMASTVPLISWIYANWGFDRLFLILSIAAGIIFISVLLLPSKVAVMFPKNSRFVLHDR